MSSLPPNSPPDQPPPGPEQPGPEQPGFEQPGPASAGSEQPGPAFASGPPPDMVSMGPLPGTPRRRIARPLVVTGVVALVVGAGAGVAAAMTGASSPSSSASSSTSQPSSTASPAPSAKPGHGFGMRGPRFFAGIGGLGAGAFGAIHGQFVVPKSGGGYQTVDTQRGQVTAVSSTSITLKSTDGFTKTYTVTSGTIVDARRDGIGSVKVGDQAAVAATVSGSTATAANIADLSNLKGLRQQFLPGGQPSPPSTG
jgi:hypothetical protein